MNRLRADVIAALGFVVVAVGCGPTDVETPSSAPPSTQHDAPLPTIVERDDAADGVLATTVVPPPPPTEMPPPPTETPPPADEPPGDEPVDEVPPVDVQTPPDEATDVAEAPASTSTCTAVARPARPATCPFVNEVVVWGQEGWNALGDAFAGNISPCTDVFISISPTAGDKTHLRAGQAERMHARGPQMHAMAEFHFATWSQVHANEGVTWKEIGRRFRDEMEAKGYCAAAGDTWAINEAPSAIRKDAAFRASFAELVSGLAEGRAGMPFMKGAVFLAGMGQKTSNMSVYKPNIEAMLEDAPFWVAMNNDVRFFGSEVYVDPRYTCLGATAAVDRRRRINNYAEHLFRLAAAGPDDVNTAQSFLSRTYVPVMNAVWDATPDRGYGDTTLNMTNMQKHIRAQVDATRSFADTHTSPDGRIGFGFASYGTPDEWDTLGNAIADAVRGAYGAGASAGGACSYGTGEGCACLQSGANENPAWAEFGTW